MSADPVISAIATTHEQMLTVRATADRLTISVAATYQLIRSGKLPHFRIGGGIRISVSDLTQFLAECRKAEPEQRITVPVPQRRKPLRHISL